MFASRRRTRRPRALRWLGLPLLALLPTLLQVAGCSDETISPAALIADAGVRSCVSGTRACVCSASGGCDPGLLCMSGRCFDTEGTKHEPPDPDVRPAPPLAVLPQLRDAAAAPSDASRDAGTDASTDAGTSSNG